MTQATRLNPDFGGSAYTVVPYSCTNACIICSSVSPLLACSSTFCNIPFAVGHGPENSPPGCEQPAAVMLHEPHMHLSSEPIFLARSENCCAVTGTIKGHVARQSKTNVEMRVRPLVMALSQNGGRSHAVRQRLDGGRFASGRQHEHRSAIWQ